MTQDPTDAPIPERPLARGASDDRRYEVKQGDTLERIAREVYGDEREWRRIAEANRGRLGDPPVLYPGQTLKLP